MIQDIDFPLVLIDDVYEPLILAARKLYRNRRSSPADLLQQAARRESPPQHVAILSKVFIFGSVVLPGDIDVSNEGSHLVERLEPVCQPIAYINEPVIRQPHAMRQLRDGLFCLRVVNTHPTRARRQHFLDPSPANPLRSPRIHTKAQIERSFQEAGAIIPSGRDPFGASANLRCDQEWGRTGLLAAYRLNTNSMEALELCLSSGENVMTFKFCFDPASTAIYCFPLIAKLIGGALMPVPMLKLHTSCKVLASWAEKVPSGCPMNTRLPAVASAPE